MSKGTPLSEIPSAGKTLAKVSHHWTVAASPNQAEYLATPWRLRFLASTKPSRH